NSPASVRGQNTPPSLPSAIPIGFSSLITPNVPDSSSGITSWLWISDFVPWRFFLFLCYALPLRRRIRSGFSANLDRSSDKPQAMIKPESALYCLERCSSVRMRKRRSVYIPIAFFSMLKST
ncbi:hypothetical protein BHM03_00005075, partial [Ensete ventricosum]